MNGGGGIQHSYCSSVGIMSKGDTEAMSSQEAQAKQDASLRTLVSRASFDNTSLLLKHSNRELVFVKQLDFLVVTMEGKAK